MEPQEASLALSSPFICTGALRTIITFSTFVFKKTEAQVL
jgi:hypothetical protein